MTLISCSITRMVILRSWILDRTFSKSSVSRTFIPAEGSSSKRILGRAVSALAISTFRWLPYGRVTAFRFLTSHSPNSLRASSAWALRVRSSGRRIGRIPLIPDRDRKFWPIRTFSQVVMFGKRRMVWKVLAIPRRAIRWDFSGARFSSSRKIEPLLHG